MPEIRKDYATDTWVLFSAARSRRPGAFRNAKSSTPKEDCPFCVGHEAMTPPELLAYREGGKRDGPGWRIRCVPNMYPAVDSTGDVRHHAEGLFVRVDGVGAHEIIVETPEHEARLSNLPETQVAEVLRSYRDRYRTLGADPRIRYVLVFKNYGERAGASLSQPRRATARPCSIGTSRSRRTSRRPPGSNAGAVSTSTPSYRRTPPPSCGARCGGATERIEPGPTTLNQRVKYRPCTSLNQMVK